MLDVQNILRFLTKEDVKISIEEFLFLNLVRLYSTDDVVAEKVTGENIVKYYKNNRYYGETSKDDLNGWKGMINNLVKRGFLVDYRKDKTSFALNELEVTEEFKNKIWKNSKEEVWDDFHSLITDKLGNTFYIGDTPVNYFSIASSDKVGGRIKSVPDMKDYFWKNICKQGDAFEIYKFFAHIEYYIEKNNGLHMKIVNFLLNYHEGTYKKEIEEMIKKDEQY